MTAPETVYLAADTKLEADVQIGPYVVFGPGVIVRGGAEIKSHSVLEGAEVKSGAVVGLHARLRPGAVIGEDARIGNFVEVKNSTIGKGTKANHLAYLGDAMVGDARTSARARSPATMTALINSKTVIGDGAFIGSTRR